MYGINKKQTTSAHPEKQIVKNKNKRATKDTETTEFSKMTCSMWLSGTVLSMTKTGRTVPST